MSPARSQGTADGDLPRPSRGPRQHQVGNVGACDQQHKPHCQREHQQGRARVADKFLAERRHQHAPSLVGRGELLFHALGNRAHLGLRGGHGNAPLEPRDCAVLMLYPPGSLAVVGQRHPVFARRARGPAEPRRHDSDHRVRSPVHRQGLADRVPPRAEAPLPEAVAQDDLSVFAGIVLVRQEHSAEQGLDAKQRKKRGGYACSQDPFRRIGTCQLLVGKGDSVEFGQRDVFENRVLLAPIEKRRHAIAARAALIGFVNPHQPIRLGKGQRPQQRGVQRAENGGVRADPERQHQDGGDRKPRPGSQGPKGVPDVAEHINRYSVLARLRPKQKRTEH